MAYKEYDIRLGLAIPFQRSINQKRYKLKTAPAFSPISIAALKRNLRIEHNDQDELLQELSDRAASSSQMSTGRQYALATFTLYLDAYPGSSEIEIELGPVGVINSVKYYAQGATGLTTVDPATYQLDNVELTARLRFLTQFTPDNARMNVIEIEFTTGWADAASLPKDLCEAILLRASEAYLHPENEQLNSKGSLLINAAEVKERNYKIQRF
jgi:uncharacterized phiE125 gp8 family phage protein